ncbi:hypothetical protein P8452_03140 [Trifolium repens]|nr:hypothetical protein P8452_03140 [Trifolium repens]
MISWERRRARGKSFLLSFDVSILITSLIPNSFSSTTLIPQSIYLFPKLLNPPKSQVAGCSSHLLRRVCSSSKIQIVIGFN